MAPTKSTTVDDHQTNVWQMGSRTVLFDREKMDQVRQTLSTVMSADAADALSIDEDFVLDWDVWKVKRIWAAPSGTFSLPRKRSVQSLRHNPEIA